MTRATGFLFDWDNESKVGTLLTSALLICPKSPSADEWMDAGEYIPEAEVSSLPSVLHLISTPSVPQILFV